MKKIVKNDIAIYPSALPARFCDKLIRQFHAGFTLGEVIDGHVSAEGVEAYRSDDFLVAKDLHLADHVRWDKLNVELHQEYVLPVLKDYLSSYEYVLADETGVDPRSCIMSLYERDRGHFCPHQDHLPGVDRSVTIICYLNTVACGGETYFFNQDYKVSPAVGTVLMFPSNFVYGHVGNMPESGDKYITVSFASVDVGDEKKAKALEAKDETGA